MPDDERSARRSRQEAAIALFALMWALAAAWHLLGNWWIGSGWTQLLLVAGIVATLLRPGAPVPLAVLALGGLATMWDEAPMLGNHWLLAGFVDLAIVGAVAVGGVRGRLHERADLANRVLPIARLSLLGFYCFAAFAKLNSSFFDRKVSCAVFFYRESTASVGATGLQAGGAGWLEHAVIVGTALTELSVPILLLMPRTRRLGVLVGLVFHGVLALDRTHQFFDFSSLLFALFTLFLPAGAAPWLAERVGSLRARLALRNDVLPRALHIAAGAVVGIVLLAILSDRLLEEVLDIGWWSWQVYAVVVVATVGRFLSQERAPADVRLLPHHPAFAVVPLLVVLNGLSPYLELKTGYGWNMYANLRTVDGETNHLLVPATLPLTDIQGDLVEVLETDDLGLTFYVGTGYALTRYELRAYLADHPDARLVYREDGRTVTLEHASDEPELVEPIPTWRQKLQLFRAVDLTEPERCVASWGPAR